MDNTTMQLRHAGRGAPTIDDCAEILVHFATQRALGRSISKIADAGLILAGLRKEADGITCVTGLRRLKGPTLERRYRRQLAEVARLTTNGAAAEPSTKPRYIGISAPRAPLSFPTPMAVKRGRPKKSRTG